MVKEKDMIPRGRLERAVPEHLKKFLPLADATGDGLLIYAFLNEMGIGSETLLNNIPHLATTSSSYMVNKIFSTGIRGETLIKEVKRSKLPKETQEEITSLLSKKVR